MNSKEIWWLNVSHDPRLAYFAIKDIFLHNWQNLNSLQIKWFWSNLSLLISTQNHREISFLGIFVLVFVSVYIAFRFSVFCLVFFFLSLFCFLSFLLDQFIEAWKFSLVLLPCFLSFSYYFLIFSSSPFYFFSLIFTLYNKLVLFSPSFYLLFLISFFSCLYLIL